MVNYYTLINVGIVLLRIVAGALLGFITTSYLARLLGPTNNGIYALIILMPAMAVAFGGFGLNAATVFIIGKEKYKIGEIISKITFVSVLIGLAIVGLLLVMMSQNFNVWIPNVPINLAYIGIAAIPIIIIYTNLIAIYHGQQNFQKHGLITLLPVLITLLIVILGENFFSDKLLFSVIAWVLGYTITLLIVMYQFRIQLGGFHKAIKVKNDFFKDVFNYGIKSYAGNLITFLNYRINFYLIGAMVNVEAIGIYAITMPIAESIWLLATAVASVLFPLIANNHDSDFRKLNPTPIISRWVFFVSGLLALIIGISANYIVEIAFGDAYLRSVVVIYLLLPGVVLFSVAKVVSSDIAGRGRPEINLYLTFVSFIANLFLANLLIPLYGLNGAAMAVSATYCLYTLILSLIYSRMTNLNIVELFVPKKNDYQKFRNAFKLKT